MKKKLLALCLCTALLIGAGGCTAASVYPDADRYSAGNAELTGTVENIEIDWTSGSVLVKTGEGSAVRITEDCRADLSEDLRVHWWLDGATLRIKYCASGTHTHFGSNGKKALTVSVPGDISLSKLTVSSASAGVRVDGVKAGAVNVSSTSGDIDVRGEASQFRLDSTSGAISLTQTGTADSAALDSTSGILRAAFENAATVTANTSSGAVELSGNMQGLSADSTSGKIACEFSAAPQLCRVNSTSGDVSLLLPQNAGFTAGVNTTSGGFSSALALVRTGNTYVYGDGSAKLTVDTTSGSISINCR